VVDAVADSFVDFPPVRKTPSTANTQIPTKIPARIFTELPELITRFSPGKEE
jgi:hypothetical protein